MKNRVLKNRLSTVANLFWLYLLFPALILFTFSGCASVDKEYRPPYKEMLKEWTRTEKVYDGLDLLLSVNATYKTEDFRSSYVDRYIEAYQLEDGSKETMAARETEEAELYNEFFLSVTTPDKSLNDFDSKDSVWKLYLEDGTGVKLSTVSIKRIETKNAMTSALFPYIDVWSIGYIVRFPKYSASGTEPIPNAKSRYMRLTVVGMLGNGELKWKLKRAKSEKKSKKAKSKKNGETPPTAQSIE